MIIYLTNGNCASGVEDNKIRVDVDKITAYYQTTKDVGGFREYKEVLRTEILLDGGGFVTVMETPKEIATKISVYKIGMARAGLR